MIVRPAGHAKDLSTLEANRTGATRGPTWRRETFEVDERSLEFEVLATAMGSFDSSGPMTFEQRQYIARRGATYYVIDEDDYGTYLTRLRHYPQESAGVAAAVRKSTAFVLDRGGAPLSLWIDEDEGADFGDQVWDSDCDSPPPQVQEELWQTVIRDGSGIVLAGPDASPTLPSEEPCYVYRGDPRDLGQLDRFGVWGTTVTLSIGEESAPAILIESVPEIILVRLALALGDGWAWRLTIDAVETLDCARENVVARAVRDWGELAGTDAPVSPPPPD